VPASGRVENDRFVDVELANFVEATDYNFGERSLRAELIKKNMLLASTSMELLLAELDIMKGVVRSAEVPSQRADATGESAVLLSPLDVNHDRVVSPLDALYLVNILTRIIHEGLRIEKRCVGEPLM
jgi:hypothetical protein